MPYIINKSNNQTFLVLNDGMTNNSISSITFIGKNVSNFGDAQNENFLHLLENFANSSLIGGQPNNPIIGQLWFDTNSQVSRPLVYDGTVWRPLAVSIYGTTSTNTLINATSTPPIPYSVNQPGDFWFNSQTNQLFVVTSTASDMTLVGPEVVPGFALTRVESSAMYDNNGNPHAVLQIVLDGEVVGILSNLTFISSSTSMISGFPVIYRGMTFKNYNSSTRYTTATSDVVFHGLHEQLDQTYPRRNINEHIQSNWSFDYGNSLNFGSNIDSSVFWNSATSSLELLSTGLITFQSPTASISFDGNSLSPSAGIVNLGTPLIPFSSIYSNEFSGGNPFNTTILDGQLTLSLQSAILPYSDVSNNIGSAGSRFSTLYAIGLSSGNSGNQGTLTGLWTLSPNSNLSPVADLSNNLGSSSLRFGTLYTSSISGITSLIGSPVIAGNLIPLPGYNLGSTLSNWTNLFVGNIQGATANIGSLIGTTSTFTSLGSTNAAIINLNATNSNLSVLASTTASIINLIASNATMNSQVVTSVSATNATIQNLNVTNETAQSVVASTGSFGIIHATTGSIGTLVMNTATVGYVNATASNAITLTAISGTISNLVSTNGNITNLVSSISTISTMAASSAVIQSLNATSVVSNGITAYTITSTNVSSQNGTITNLNSTNLLANQLSFNTLVGYLYANSSTAATASPTIPGSAISGNISGNSSNITSYSINQNLSTSTSPTFAGLTVVGQLSVATATVYTSAVNLGMFRSSLTGYGYMKLPGGFIMQWGSASVNDGSYVVNLPITFPTEGLSVVGSQNSQSQKGLQNNPQFWFIDNSHIGADCWEDSLISIFYIAIGH